MFEALNSFIQSCADHSDEEIAFINSLFQHKTIKKKTLLLREGELCNYEIFVNKGCIRNYYIDKQGAEVTLQFAIEGWWISDISSFHERKPSHMFIETLEDCEVLMLSYDAKERLLTKAPKFERMFRLLVQRNLSRMQERLFQTIATTAAEKYLDFIERYPTIPQRVAQHYIASYLGFSPEFLSKVRTKLAKN